MGGQCQADLQLDATCFDRSQCGGGLVCVGEDLTGNSELTPLGQCVPRPGNNEPCDNTCTAGFFCQGFDDMSLGTCQPTGTDDAPCDSSSQCARFSGYTCDGDTGTCQRLPGDGMACLNSRCDDALACINDVCGEPLANGEICTDGEECESFYCDPDSGRCAEFPLCYP
jgi:hypothetical protein